MKPSSEHDEHDREIIELLKGLGQIKSGYPSELLAARRAAFLARVEQLSPADADEVWSAEDHEIINLLGDLKSAQAEYPPDLLAARRSALLQQMERIERVTSRDETRVSPPRKFQSRITIPTLLRFSFIVAGLLAVVLLRSLFFSGTQQSVLPLPLQGAAGSTGTEEATMDVCKSGDPLSSCPSGELDPAQDLADPGNGAAQPAVSSEARSNQDGSQKAANANDGLGSTSWVSRSPDAWIKIDLGQVATINTVSLQKGSASSSGESSSGQFVIAVALSDVYADGDSVDDYVEYAQVFRSEGRDFSSTDSDTEMIKTQFAPVRARFVKITFAQAGAAIEEVGVYMIQPPALAAQPTGTTPEEPGLITRTPTHTNIPSLVDTEVSVPTNTLLPANTAVSIPTDTPTQLPTSTAPPVDTATPVPTAPLPTVAPPTLIPPTIQVPPVSSDPIVVTGADQTLTFTCNGNAAEIRGHANTITLLGSCSSITVTGNGNRVFWQFGSPVITNRGRDNIILQL